MAQQWQQTGTNSSSPWTGTKCDSTALATNPCEKVISSSGSGGSQVIVTLPAKQSYTGCTFAPDAALGVTSIPSGTWNVKVNITSAASSGSLLDAVYICRLDSGGSPQATIASATGLTHSIAATGVISVDVTQGSPHACSTTDRFYVQVSFFSNSHGGTTVGVTPDQLITDTITAVTQVDCQVDAVTCTDYNASISAKVTFTANSDAITVTGYNVSIPWPVQIDCQIDAVTITDLNAGINAEVFVGAGTDTTTITGYDVNLPLKIPDIPAVTITEYAADIDAPGVVFRQQSFRWRDEDGTETTANWKAATNNNPAQIYPEVHYRIRFLIQEIGGTAGGNGSSFSLYFNRNSGGWTKAADGQAVETVNVAGLTNNTDTTQQIGAGTFLSNNDGQTESDNDWTLPTDLPANNETEVEFSFYVNSTVVSNGDTIELRVEYSDGTDLDSYINSPSVTLSKPAYTRFEVSHYRWRDDDDDEASATWLAPVDTPIALPADTGRRCRLLITEKYGEPFGGKVGTANLWWYYVRRINDGGGAAVTTSSTYLKTYDSQLTNGGDTTQQLGSGSFYSDNDGQNENTSSYDCGVGYANGSDEFEVEIAVQAVGVDCTPGDKLELVFYANLAGGTWIEQTHAVEPHGFFQLVTISATTDAVTITGYNTNISIGAGVDVDCTVDAVTITGKNATISADLSIECAVDAVAVTGYSPGVNAVVACASDAVTITGYDVSVSAEVTLTTTTDAVTITGYNPDIPWGQAVQIDCVTDAVIVTDYNVVISADVTFTATSDIVTCTEYDTSISIDNTIEISSDAVIITDYNATITFDETIHATSDAVTITGYNANISAGNEIACAVDAVIITAYNASIDLTIAATTDSISLVGKNAAISADTGILAQVDSVTITPHDASIIFDITFTTTIDTVTLTGLTATISAGNEIGCSTDAVIITGFKTGVTAVVRCSADAITITPYDVGISANKTIYCDSDAITITAYDVGISADKTVYCDSDAITITAYDVGISANQTIEVASDTVTITSYDPTVLVGGAVQVDCTIDAVTITPHNVAIPILCALGTIAITGHGVVTGETHTYYCRADGTAGSKEAATSDLYASTSMSPFRHNQEVDEFQPGDTIVISDQGGVYRGGEDGHGRSFNITCSGSASMPITYRANNTSDPSAVNGTPILSGSVEYTSDWVDASGEGTGLWYHEHCCLAREVWFDDTPGLTEITGTRGTEVSAQIDLDAEFEWWWDSGNSRVYIFVPDSDNPNTRYESVEIPHSSNTDPCYNRIMERGSLGGDYVHLENLILEKAHGGNGGGWRVLNPTNSMIGWEFRNCQFNKCWENGFYNKVDTENSYVDDILITDCQGWYNGACDFKLVGEVTNAIIQRCIAAWSGVYVNGGASDQHSNTAGIKLNGGGTWNGEQNGTIVQYCEAHHHNYYGSNTGSGIWQDGGLVINTIHRYNFVHHNRHVGIRNEGGDYSLTYGNVCWGNRSQNIGLRGGTGTMKITGCVIYNNTIYGLGSGDLYGIHLTGDGATTDSITNCIVKNNIAINCASRNLRCIDGAENDGTYGSGNIYSKNCFGDEVEEGAGFIQWGETAYDTYDDWRDVTDRTENPDNHIEENPKFQNVAAAQFFLQPDSPCIDVGEDLGLAYDDALHPISAWPENVATLDQNNYGGGWDLGAYIAAVMVMGTVGAAAITGHDCITSGRTYYCRADGTAQSKYAATSDADPSTAMSNYYHNQQTFQPGDEVVISDAGGVYRGGTHNHRAFNVNANRSGKPGFPVVYRANEGGTPVISGCAAYTDGWTNESGQIWYHLHGEEATPGAGPRDVWFDDTPGTTTMVGERGNKVADKGSLAAEFDWWYDSTNKYLYIYVPATGDSNPNTRYSLIEANYTNASTYFRDAFEVGGTGAHDIVFQNIIFEKGGTDTFRCYNPSAAVNRLTFTNCQFNKAYENGCRFVTDGYYTEGMLFEDCQAHYNGGSGIRPGGGDSDGTTVRRCIVRYNGWYKYSDTGNSQHATPGGIKINSQSPNEATNVLFEYNICSHTCPNESNNGSGIWSDMGNVTGAIFRYNYCHDNHHSGVRNEGSDDNEIYGNVCINNKQAGVNIRGGSASTMKANGNKVYNNTIFGQTLYGLSFGYDASPDSLTNTICKNNISITNTGQNLRAPANDGINCYGNVFERNCLGPDPDPPRNFIWWGGAGYTTYDAWLAVSGQTDNNIEADPDFYDESNLILRLKVTSPCIDAAEDLGDTYKIVLDPASTWPDGVALRDQDDYGDGWELGAYVYTHEYYWANDGTAPHKEAAVTGIYPEGCMNLSVLQGETFSPGDSVLLSSAGGIVRETVSLPDYSGTAAKPITYGVKEGESPTISGANIITGWSSHPTYSNVWQVTYEEPAQIFLDGVRGAIDPSDDVESLAQNGDWYWASNVLYLYCDIGDPDTVYTDPGVEGAIRARGIWAYPGDIHYIIIEGFNVINTANYGIQIYTDCSHWIVRNNYIGYGDGKGIRWEQSSDYNLIENNTIEYMTGDCCGGAGSWVSSNGSGVAVGGEYNIVQNNILRYSIWRDSRNSAAGIKTFGFHYGIFRNNEVYGNEGGGVRFDGGGTYPSNWGCHDSIVEHNLIYDNDYSGEDRGGVHIEHGWDNIVRHNWIKSDHTSGVKLRLSGCFDNSVHHNVILGGNGTGPTQVGIHTDNRSDGGGHLIYNNTILNCGHGLQIGQANCRIKNNLVDGTSALGANWDLIISTTAAYSGLQSDYNCFTGDGTSQVRDNEGNNNWTIAEHCSNKGQDCNSIGSEPLLFDVSNDKYWPRAGSPLIDAGVDLGSAYAYALKTDSSWPDDVNTLNQNNHGEGWEIGAFIYEEPYRGTNYWYLTGSGGSNYIDTTFSGTTTDFDVRVLVRHETQPQNGTLIGQWPGLAVGYGWRIVIRSDDTVQFIWSENGSDIKQFVSSDFSSYVADGDIGWWRVTMDVDNGSQREFALFWSANGRDWTEISRLYGPITSLHNSDAGVRIGNSEHSPQTSEWKGRVYAARRMTAIDATTTIFDLDFTDLDQLTSTPPDYTEWLDTNNNIWIVHGAAPVYYPGIKQTATQDVAIAAYTAKIISDVIARCITGTINVVGIRSTVSQPVDIAASADAVTISEYNSTIDINKIFATTDTVAITSYNALINSTIHVAGAVDTATITAHDADVRIIQLVEAVTDAVAINGNDIVLNLQTPIRVGYAPINITAFEVGLDTALYPTCGAVTITGHNADIQLFGYIGCDTGAVSIAPYAARIDASVVVSATLATTSLTGQGASIAAEVTLTTALDELTITSQDVGLPVLIKAQADATTITGYNCSLNIEQIIVTGIAAVSVVDYTAVVQFAREIQTSEEKMVMWPWTARIGAGQPVHVANYGIVWATTHHFPTLNIAVGVIADTAATVITGHACGVHITPIIPTTLQTIDITGYKTTTSIFAISDAVHDIVSDILTLVQYHDLATVYSIDHDIESDELNLAVFPDQFPLDEYYPLENYYTLPPVMKLPLRPEDSSELLEYVRELHTLLQEHYIPQSDRIENMIMVGETRRRPDAKGMRQYYYDENRRTLYLDCMSQETNEPTWVSLGSTATERQMIYNEWETLHVLTLDEGSMGGTQTNYTIRCTDGSDYSAETSQIMLSALREDATTLVHSQTKVTGANISSAGTTLDVEAQSVAVDNDKISLQIRVTTTGYTPTSIFIRYTVWQSDDSQELIL